MAAADRVGPGPQNFKKSSCPVSSNLIFTTPFVSRSRRTCFVPTTRAVTGHLNFTFQSLLSSDPPWLPSPVSPPASSAPRRRARSPRRLRGECLGRPRTTTHPQDPTPHPSVKSTALTRVGRSGTPRKSPRRTEPPPPLTRPRAPRLRPSISFQLALHPDRRGS